MVIFNFVLSKSSVCFVLTLGAGVHVVCVLGGGGGDGGASPPLGIHISFVTRG